MSYRLSDSSAKVIDENGEELTNYRLHLSARPRNYLDYKVNTLAEYLLLSCRANLAFPKFFLLRMVNLSKLPKYR